MAERPRLGLKPRSTEAAPSAVWRLERQVQPLRRRQAARAVPPRAAASRGGHIKKQADEYKGKLNLSRKQREEKEAIEDKIESAKEVLKAEGEGEKAEALKAELEKAENELKELMDGFEKLATETAHKGGDRTLAEKREAEMMGGSIVQGGGRPVDEGYGNFGGRGVGGGGNYGGRGGQGEQYANFGGADRAEETTAGTLAGVAATRPEETTAGPLAGAAAARMYDCASPSCPFACIRVCVRMRARERASERWSECTCAYATPQR